MLVGYLAVLGEVHMKADQRELLAENGPVGRVVLGEQEQAALSLGLLA